ncbi:unnamed protein product [Closterium sp. Naga37s-1]|nr:unnamed protein product [Closterium sp. Naga37s-1]
MALSSTSAVARQLAAARVSTFTASSSQIRTHHLPAQHLGIRAVNSAPGDSASRSSSNFSGGRAGSFTESAGLVEEEAGSAAEAAGSEAEGTKGVRGEAAAAAARAAAEANPPRMFFSSVSVDRAGQYRNDAAWLKKALGKPTTVVIPWSHGRSLIKDGRAVLASPAHITVNPATTAPHGTAASDGAADAASNSTTTATTTTSSSSASGTGVEPFCFLGLLMPSGHAAFAVAIDSAASPPQDASAAPLPAYTPPEGAQWVSLRTQGPTLPAFDAGLLAYANGLMDWHSRHRFCSQCAAPLIQAEGGYARRCTNSFPSPPALPAAAVPPAPAAAAAGLVTAADSNGTAQPSSLSPAPSPAGKPKCSSSTIFPRLDPAVIMCVSWGDYVLLGRQSRWPHGRYSVLAGFVEVGEAFEMAVVREVWEEARVHVDPDTVRYHASQPWPFPSSLMVAFTAQALPSGPPAMALSQPDYGLTGEERGAALVPWQQLPVVRTDTNELEDARWFHREFIRALLSDSSCNTWIQQPPAEDNSPATPAPPAQPSGTTWAFPPLPRSAVAIPGPHAIAHSLLAGWAMGDGGGEGREGREEKEDVEDGDWPGHGVPDVDIDTGDVDIDTGDVDIDTGDVDIDTGDVDVDTGDVDIDTGDVDVDKCDVDIDTGDVDVDTSCGDERSEALYSLLFFLTHSLLHALQNSLPPSSSSTFSLRPSPPFLPLLTFSHLFLPLSPHPAQIVRGDKRAPFHNDVLQHTARFMAPLGLKVRFMAPLGLKVRFMAPLGLKVRFMAPLGLKGCMHMGAYHVMGHTVPWGPLQGLHAPCLTRILHGQVEAVGGGRINHDAAKKQITIYGFSQVRVV